MQHPVHDRSRRTSRSKRAGDGIPQGEDRNRSESGDPMRMNIRHLFFGAAAASALAASAASAKDAPPPPAFTITGGATLVSDYRFRGISQTDRDIAVQGTATLSHSSGFYVTFWGSS